MRKIESFNSRTLKARIVTIDFFGDHMRTNVKPSRERYISIVTEGDRRSAQHVINAIGAQVALMEARGYSVKQRDDYVFKVLADIERGRMNEGILDSIGGLLSWASENKVLQTIQGWIGKKLVGILGVDPNSFMGKVIINFIENLEFSKIKQMFSGEGACRPLVSELAGAVQEALVEKGIRALGLEPESAFGKMLQEVLQAAFVEEGIFVDKVTDMVCSINISELMPGGKADLQAAVSGAGAAAPSPA
jgi:hypothetical protein